MSVYTRERLAIFNTGSESWRASIAYVDAGAIQTQDPMILDTQHGGTNPTKNYSCMNIVNMYKHTWNIYS